MQKKMKQPDFWKCNSVLSKILAPFSLLYSLLSLIRTAMASPYKASIPVICIGNVTVGGAGKTPVALTVCKLLMDASYSPAFLSRGYGGRIKGPAQVINSLHISQDIGDEPLLLSKLATTVISKNRAKGLKFLSNQNSDVIILDDGLQNPTIEKDISLLVIDGGYGIGNGRIMPAGPLRESLESALHKSDAVIFIGDDKTGVLPKLKSLEIIKAKISPKENNINKDRDFIAFAGLANPDKFFNTLEENGYKLLDKLYFKDHYNYTDKDISLLKRTAEEEGASLITTEKDFIRLTKEQQNGIDEFPIEIIWEDERQIVNIINKIKK